MKSPADMKIIQIDITNACMYSCSNCTRFCGQHSKPFFMELETFRRAVDSLAGFEGIIGIIGGEPTLHSQFDKLVDYFAAQVNRDTLRRGVGRRRVAAARSRS
jgi:MoaA/NifB/PqqE/SkfB family radical SAM enzyme